MADMLFLCFIIFVVLYFINKSRQYHKNKMPTAKDIQKYYGKRAALRHKYQSHVPSCSKDGNPYLTTKQAIDKVGVHSKEYHRELTALNKSVGINSS